MTDRLFVALWPDETARAALSADVSRTRQQHPDLSWQPDERWHLTLAFLGQADDATAMRRLDRIAASGLPHPEPIRLVGAGTFGPVLWVGAEHGPWLTDLARRVQHGLHVTDRRFRAHVTVGRARGRPGPATAVARAAVPALSEHAGPLWMPSHLTLVASRTGPHPHYTVLARWRLDGSGVADSTGMSAFPADERVVHRSATVGAPTEDVWWAWTTDAGIRSWLVDDSWIDLRVGGPYEWYFLSEADPGGRGSEGCQIIGFQEPTLLTFTWNAPPHLSEARAQRSVVLLRLRPLEDDHTRVELTQLGWGDGGQWDEAFDYFDAAWDRVLTRLVAYFADADELPET